jgi:hypothetical protein
MYSSHEHTTESQQNTVTHKINTCLFPLQHVLSFYMVILRYGYLEGDLFRQHQYKILFSKRTLKRALQNVEIYRRGNKQSFILQSHVHC